MTKARKRRLQKLAEQPDDQSIVAQDMPGWDELGLEEDDDNPDYQYLEFERAQLEATRRSNTPRRPAARVRRLRRNDQGS